MRGLLFQVLVLGNPLNRVDSGPKHWIRNLITKLCLSKGTLTILYIVYNSFTLACFMCVVMYSWTGGAVCNVTY